MWPNPQFPAHLVTFTEEILNGKLHFLCSESNKIFELTPSAPNPCHYHLYPSSYYVTTITKLFRNLTSRQSSVMSVCWIAHISHLNSLSCFGLPLIPLHSLCIQHLQNWQRMNYYLHPYCKLTNFPFLVTFPEFSQLIIIFVFITFTINPFELNAPFHASSRPFKPSNYSVTNIKSSA